MAYLRSRKWRASILAFSAPAPSLGHKWLVGVGKWAPVAASGDPIHGYHFEIHISLCHNNDTLLPVASLFPAIQLMLCGLLKMDIAN